MILSIIQNNNTLRKKKTSGNILDGQARWPGYIDITLMPQSINMF